MPLTGAQWAHLAVSGIIWLVIPLAIGLWRILRAEVEVGPTGRRRAG